MKRKTIALSMLTLLISQTVRADYSIFYPLKDRPLKFVVTGIDGSVKFDKSTINRGESTNIIWDYKYVSKIDIDDLGSYNDKSGSASVNPIRSKTYNITVHNGDNYKNEKLNLTVIQPDPEITFIADRYKIGVGESVNLSWDVKNIDSASIDNNIGVINSKANIKVTPEDDITYKLTAKGYFGEKESSKLLTIDVIKNSVVNFLAVNKNKFTVGESALFNWSVTGSENLELSPYGNVDVNQSSASILLNQSGNFDYTLKSTSFNNSIQSSNIIPISVYNNPTISSFIVNNKKIVDVESGDDLKFDWVAKDSETTKLDGILVSGNTKNLKAPDSNKTYTLEAINGAGKSITDNVIVNIVEPVAISNVSAPAIVFNNSPFIMSWTGTGVSKYELSSVSGSGVSSNEDLDLNTSKSITPTSVGNYTYTLKATNLADKSTTSTANVVVEKDPELSSLIVNGQSEIIVSPNAALNFSMVGASSGATLQGRNNTGTADLTLPTIANSTAGTINYYASSFKALNGISRYSPVRSVAVTVVNAPTINSFTAPTNVFINSPFTLAWTGTNATNYQLKSNNSTSGISTTDVDLGSSNSRSVTATAVGSYNYTLTVTNAAGVKDSSIKQVNVESLPTFSNFTVNGASSITVSPSAALAFSGTGFSTGSTLQGRNSAGTANATLPSTASATAGTTTYYASASKTLNGVTNTSAVRSVSVTVVDAPTISSITAPTSVFSGSAFTMSWSGNNVTNYKIKSNNVSSGISTSDVDLDNTTTQGITPTAAGTYIYTITATNDAGVSVSSTKQVIVEALPTFTGFVVNGAATVTVSPSTSLTFTGSGFSSGATLQGRNSAGTANATLPTTASATAGTTTYYASATKTINGVTNNSAVRSVSVVVVNAPTVTITAVPTVVFEDSSFTLSWTGTNATNYKIKSNNANSGIATSDVDLDTDLSTSITPTSAGTYVYTITATNAAGVTATKTATVVVEALPTFTGFTVNGTSTVTVAPSTALTFLGTGFSSGASLQGRNSAGTANATLPTTASATAGTTTYYASATKTINGVTNNSAVRSVSVVVVNAPAITALTAPTAVFEDASFTMSWTGNNVTNYKIKSNNVNSGVTTTDVDLDTDSSLSITPTSAGTYTYTLTATNAAGVTTTATKQVIVESIPTFTGFTVNGLNSINVAPSASLSFAGTGFSTGATLQGRNSAGTANATLPTTASATVGSTIYYASGSKTLNGITNYSAVRSVVVNVINAPVISSITAPSPVFINSSFTMNWSGTDVSNYTIKSNDANSGIAITDVDLNTATSRSITPIAAGTYVYTITATNVAGVTTSKTITVVVEGLPTFTNFTVNSTANITVAPSAALTFAGTGFSSGATLQGRNSAGTANATLPTTASATAGTTTYYASAVKLLNGVTNYSAVRSVSVVVAANPVITSITAPSTVFSGEAFTMSWVATDAINYKIKSNNVNSGVATTDIDLSTATSRSITPTSAGTYVYTITATNAAGVITTKTASVSVSNSYLKIINPQASSGIYNVTDGKGGSIPVYVNMTMDGGYWLLIARWTNFPASAGDKTFNNVVVNGQSLATYTMDAANYPVIPSGYTNTSSRAMFTSANTGWTNLYGQWQSFNTFAGGSVLNSSGFSASTPLGAKTFYAVTTGWASDGTTTAPMASVFGLWTAYGNGGACGGAGIVTPNRICAALSNGLQANHLDSTSVKSLYIKASN